MGIKTRDHQYIYGCLLSFILEGNVKFQVEISENEDIPLFAILGYPLPDIPFIFIYFLSLKVLVQQAV